MDQQRILPPAVAFASSSLPWLFVPAPVANSQSRRETGLAPEQANPATHSQARRRTCCFTVPNAGRAAGLFCQLQRLI